jgi:hypothetical protein
MKKTWLWVLIALGGSCFVCAAGGLALLALGAVSGGDGMGQASPARSEGTPGAPGGFSFTAPQGWTSPGPGRWLTQREDGSARLTVEVIRLPAIAGLEQPAEKLAAFWRDRVGADWEVGETPLVLRRFVANGARAYFTSAPLRPKRGGTETRVSAYLVEADDRLEPLVVLQGYDEPGQYASIIEHMAQFSWDKTHPLVEQVIAGTAGSPVGLPLASDEEVAGRWVHSTATSMQWVHTITGSTSMSTVSYSVKFEFGEDHHFTYSFQGASGEVGAMQFSSDKDEGEWRVEHDLLVLEGKQGTKKYLIAGAGRQPGGKRTLFLMPERQWSLSPGALARSGELYVEA